MNSVHTIDLNFMGMPGVIASYLIPHSHGAMLVETGPGSTLPSLQAGLERHGYSVQDITDILLTHIHMDHAGASGWLARQGARIHVHPQGAPHLLDPQKLISSAIRIYGEENMNTILGDMLAVPPECLNILADGDVIEIGGCQVQALDTPGHASHHFAYLYDGLCFSGDIAGIRMFWRRHVVLPTPPPEFNLEQWRQSLARLGATYSEGKIRQIAPTHFGIHADPAWHLETARRYLEAMAEWIDATLPANPDDATMMEQFQAWQAGQLDLAGLEEQDLVALDELLPTWMSVSGIRRYWTKVRAVRAS